MLNERPGGVDLTPPTVVGLKTFKHKEKRLVVVSEVGCDFFGEVSLVHICPNARGILVCVHVYCMLLFCFIQEANFDLDQLFYVSFCVIVLIYL